MVNTAIIFTPDYLSFNISLCTVFGKKSTILTLKKIYQKGILWSDFGHTQLADGGDK